MAETAEEILDPSIFEGVGRNDPCPCGSGKKFKKCHFKKIQVLKQTKDQSVSLNKFIGSGQYLYQWLKAYQMLVNRRDWGLIHETFLPDSDIAQAMGDASSFVEMARGSSDKVPAAGDFDVVRYRMNQEFGFIMGVRNADNRRVKNVTFEVLTLINTNRGFRVTNVEYLERPKGDDLETPEFEEFECVKTILERVRGREWQRPVIPRWNPDTEKFELPEGVKDTRGSAAADGALIETSSEEAGDDVAASSDVAAAAPVVTLGTTEE